MKSAEFFALALVGGFALGLLGVLQYLHVAMPAWWPW